MTSPLSVVIAAYDAEATIRDQVTALTSQHWPNGGEIIVADNGSTDATAQIVLAESQALGARHNISITVVDCPEKVGAAYARNVGVRASQFAHIAFCDADDIVGDGWVEAIGNALSRHRAVGGQLELNKLNSRAAVTSRGTGVDSKGLPQFDGLFPVLSSCNLGIHRATFDQLGGFDEDYLRGQDAELSFRLFDQGIETHFASDAVVHYRLRTGLRAIFRQARGWGEVNGRLRNRLQRHPRWRTSFRSCLWLVVHVGHLRQPAKRARWVYIAGIRAGLISNGIHRRRSRAKSGLTSPFLGLKN